ncbi:d83b8d4c-3dad-4349-95ef-d88f1e758064 [Thermothielavioides terrestris]|uniref:D83b8d4c-3dad-4349-95ef-d88f1e758064 n=1 Tax=Thermothielavioides terrestris TaxID=2587410 RepID=A0A3S4F2Y6_9PEZI|nr:d83b8d4c-3dad-4349-95ef-d88f1e758064 [Thermothielavioides terrestris]
MPLGLGRLVGTVVSSAGFDADPARCARAAWERAGRRPAPNGSLMRTHPVGMICLWRAEGEAFALAAALSRVTHADPSGEGEVDALVERAVEWCRGEDAEGMAMVNVEELWRHVKPDGGLEALQLDERAAIGYVYKTLGSGVVLLRMAMRRMAASQGGLLDRTRLFEELITDLHGLKHEAWLLGKAEALCQVLGLKDGEYNGKDDKDTEVHGGKPELSKEEMEVRWMLLQQAMVKKMEDAAKAAASSAKDTSSRWPFAWLSNGPK